MKFMHLIISLCIYILQKGNFWAKQAPFSVNGRIWIRHGRRHCHQHHASTTKAKGLKVLWSKAKTLGTMGGWNKGLVSACSTVARDSRYTRRSCQSLRALRGENARTNFASGSSNGGGSLLPQSDGLRGSLGLSSLKTKICCKNLKSRVSDHFTFASIFHFKNHHFHNQVHKENPASLCPTWEIVAMNGSGLANMGSIRRSRISGRWALVIT